MPTDETSHQPLPSTPATLSDEAAECLAMSVEMSTGDGPTSLNTLVENGTVTLNREETPGTEALLAEPDYGPGVFDVYVEADLLADVSASLAVYEADLEAEGYTVEIVSFDGTAEELRGRLQDRWSMDDLEGALFVGDLPSLRFSFNGEYPHDLYFMDMDGTYVLNDTTEDEHTGDVAPEIYVSRLAASPVTDLTGESEADLINAYFDRVHRVRTGELTYEDRGLIFSDDDWEPHFVGILDTLYEDVTDLRDPNETTRDAYIDLLGQNAESMFEAIHSWPSGHSVDGVGGGVITAADLVGINPNVGFLNMFNCSSADFTAQDNLASTYVFGSDYVLNTIGSGKTGGMLNEPEFYDPQANGASMGEAFVDWFQTNVGSTDDPSTHWAIDWHYSMTMQGDPTLRPAAISPSMTAQLVESFETDGLGTRYTADEAFTASSHDIFNRTDGSDISVETAYGGIDGDYFWAIEDTDGGPNGEDVQLLELTGIDISGLTDPSVSALVGAAGGAEFDSSDYLAILYRVDGGAYETGLLFRSEGSRNTPMSLVTDLQYDDGVSAAEAADELRDADGDGDGKVNDVVDTFGDPSQSLNNVLSEFAFDIEEGSTLDIIVAAHADGNHEELAFDRIAVSGGGVVEERVQNTNTGVFYGSIADAVAEASAGNEIVVLPAYDLASETVTVTVDALTIDLPAGINPPTFDLEVERLDLTGEGRATINADDSGSTVVGNEGNNTLNGGAGRDDFEGNGGDDFYTPAGDDNDLFIGGSGVQDVVALSGPIADYDIGEQDDTGESLITHARGTQADGRVFIQQVEAASFDGSLVALANRDNYGRNVSPDKAFDLTGFEGTSLFDIDGYGEVFSITGPYGLARDQDWYRIDLADTSGLALDFRNVNDETGFDFGLFDASGSEITPSSVTPIDAFADTYTYNSLTAGSYFVRVEADTEDEEGIYNLTWNGVPPVEGAVRNTTQGVSFDTIEDAVAAAEVGDTIVIDPVLYTLPSEIVLVEVENLTIDVPAGINMPFFETTVNLITFTGDGELDVEGDISDNQVIGNEARNTFDGADGDDLFEGRGGDDEADLAGGDAGGEQDVAVFSGTISEYDISFEPDATDEFTFVHARGSQADGTDFIKGAEGAFFDGDLISLRLNDNYGYNYAQHQAYDLSAFEGQSLESIDGRGVVRSWEGEYGTALEENWFRVDLTETSDIVFDLEYTNDDSGLIFTLFDAAGNELTEVGNSPDPTPTFGETTESFDYNGLAPGSYFVRVFASTESETAEYSFTWNATPSTDLPVRNTTSGESFATIAAAMAAAIAGDSIVIDPSYAEPSETVTVTEINITVDVPAGINKPTFIVDHFGDFTMTGDGAVDASRLRSGEIPELTGNEGVNTLEGASGDDYLRGNGEDDTLDGRGGNDRALFAGERFEYDITYNEATETYTVTHARGTQEDGSDTVRDIDGIIYDVLSSDHYLVVNDPYGWHGSPNAAVDLTGFEGVPLSDTSGVATVSQDPNDWGALEEYDFYRFDLSSQTEEVSITVDPTTTDNRVLYRLLDASFNELGSWDVTRDSPPWEPTPVTVSDLAAGTYYIEVEKGGDGDASYDLAWAIEDPGEGPFLPEIPVVDPDDAIDGLVGTDGADDLVIGTDNGEKLDGKGGADILFGEGGNDTLRGRDGDDILVAGEGNDQAEGDAGNDILFGEGGNDKLRGREDNDTLLGGLGDDWLRGDEGDDILAFGEGADLVDGGSGADTFIFVGDGDGSLIEDFNLSEGDTLDLRLAIDVTGDPADFVRLDQQGDQTVVQLNADGLGADFVDAFVFEGDAVGVDLATLLANDDLLI